MADTTVSDRDVGHLGLQPRCGICADTVLRHERVVALFGDSDSTSYRGCTRPFPFPQLNPGHIAPRVDGLRLCRHLSCSKCAKSPEFVPVHFDCFEIFKQRCTVSVSAALNRLWILAAWRNPWRGALPVPLSAPPVDRDTLGTMLSSGLFGLPRLCTLPSELLEMIRHHSRHSLLWRCIPALQLAAHVSATGPEPLLTVPLRELLSWECGGKLERVTASQSPLTTLRLTIDSVGISRVERLPGPPLYSGELTSCAAFIVEDEASISEVMAQLKDGRMRLGFPVRPNLPTRVLPIWNTPAPPSLALCKAYPTDIVSCQALYAVEMDKVKGVTFFFSRGSLCGIHVHYSDESCAIDTYTRNFARYRWRTTVWLYLPISEHDRLLSLGVRIALQDPDTSILVRTELTGDTTIGLQSRDNGAVEQRCLAASAPVTLVYGEDRGGDPIRFFGAHCSPPALDDRALPEPAPFCLEKPGPSPMDRIAYFSWAPLRGVLSTLVFCDEKTGFCRGIMFRYDNGGSRAVGQCRLHVDPAERVVRPTRFSFRSDPYRLSWRPDRWLHALQLKFGQSSLADDPDAEGWESRPMEGLVKFWFTPESSFLVVEN